MPHVEVNGINLYYELTGDGPETVVLNNGVFMNTAAWAFTTPVLARHYRVLTWDLRGQLQSDKPPADGYTIDQHVADLRGLLDALAIDRAHIVGISLGCAVTLTFGLDHPERVLSLVGAAPLPRVDPYTAIWVDSWAYAARSGDPVHFATTVLPWAYAPATVLANPNIRRQAEDRYRGVDLPAAVRLLEGFQSFDIEARLPGLSRPTGLIAAEHDLIMPPRFAYASAAAIPGSQLHLIPRAGHAMHAERPNEFNTIVLGFLSLCKSHSLSPV